MICEGSPIEYRKDFELWWPKYDHAPEACHARVTKTVHDVDCAVSMCKRNLLVVQAGGHAGVWPMYLAKVFNEVMTFEPDPALFACLVRNTVSFGDRIIPNHEALGSSIGVARMRSHISAGSWSVREDGDVLVSMTTIDELRLGRCDLIVLDVEAYEVEVLNGAINTIENYSPIIHVEELPRAKDAIREHMEKIGYVLHKEVRKDAVYKRRKR